MSAPARRPFGLLLIASLVGFALAIPAAAAARQSEPLSARLEVEKGPYHVGQGIEIGVAVTARDQRPTLELPTPRDARIFISGTSFRPVSASTIGSVQSGANVYLTRLCVVPGKAGPLDIPAIGVRLGDRTERTRALKLKIEPVPTEGRPAGFLGGVGEFAVDATATPAAVRVGQPILYRIEIRGPAAWGSRVAPDLSRLAQLPVAPKIDELPQEASDEPPTRTFAFRVRPTKPGDVVLPPVSISAYDVEAGRYFTKVTRGVPIRAIAVPELETRSVERPASPEPAVRWSRTAAGLATVFGAVSLVVASRLLRRARRAGQGRAAARPLARRLAAGLAIPTGASEGQGGDHAAVFAGELMEALTTYAATAASRPPGALTPAEARELFGSLTGSQEIASRACRLVEWCDRALFSDEAGMDGLAEVRQESVAFLEGLGGRSLRRPRILRRRDRSSV